MGHRRATDRRLQLHLASGWTIRCALAGTVGYAAARALRDLVLPMFG